MTLTTERQQFAEQNEMSMEFVNWFFDEKKESFGNMWFLMAAALWEGWKGRANREAQPVGRGNLTKIAAELVRGDYLNSLWHEAETSKHISTHRLQNLLDELHDVMKVKAIALTQVITAPPAPAVPPGYRLQPISEYDAMCEYVSDAAPAPAVPDKATPGSIEILASGYSNGTFQLDDDEANLATEIWNACRAAMLAQPVSSGYKLPGCEWTYDDNDSKWDSACGEAWMFSDGGPTENGVKFCQGCGKPVLLAAAPESVNGA
ncbi:TPA: hypothetical protein SMI06_001748 [Serratia marcescens]|nr:hypothetical protein [Serratia marcescens]